MMKGRHQRLRQPARIGTAQGNQQLRVTTREHVNGWRAQGEHIGADHVQMRPHLYPPRERRFAICKQRIINYRQVTGKIANSGTGEQHDSPCPGGIIYLAIRHREIGPVTDQQVAGYGRFQGG